MKKIYQIPKSQLSVLIVFGVIAEFVVLFSSIDCYESCGALTFFDIFIPFLVVFYFVGWRYYNKNILDNSVKNRGEKICGKCNQKNVPDSKYCLSCGEGI